MTKNNDGVLLGIAGRLFRQNGYAATSLREVAAAAGMLPGSLHYRFPSKEGLLLALMERGLRRALATVRTAMDHGHDPLDRMRRALRAHIALLVEGDDAIYVNLYELRGISGVERARIVALRDTYEALWEGMLHAAAGAGLVRAGVDLGMVRRLLLGSANWTAQWYAAEGTRTAEQIADALLATVAFGFIADEPTRNSAVAAALLSAQRSTDTRPDEETC